MTVCASSLVAPLLDDGHAGSAWPAVAMGRSTVTYGELRRNVMSVRDDMLRVGIGPGDRVAICMPKSIAALELILGTLAAGAAYVPINHSLPVSQIRSIVTDIRPKLLVVPPTARCDAIAVPGLRIATCEIAAGAAIGELHVLPGIMPEISSPPWLATILYTSGSTGEPKGIMLSQGNLASFVDWAATTFRIVSTDRVANHASFHFDLSIFDIFCTLGHGGTVFLIDDHTSLFPGAMRALVADAGISVWYSVPTALVRLQERHAMQGLSSLRLILFAGEVFPVPALRGLMAELPGPTYVNLYGPTETNVCTWHQLAEPPSSDQDVVPIGRPCGHLEVTLRDPLGAEVGVGEPGEICVSGAGVMLGYWQRTAMTEVTRFDGRADSYRTGDYGFMRPDRTLMLIGRRDQQVKVRGHRLELLALEATLSAHPKIRDAVAVTTSQSGRHELVVFVTAREEPAPATVLRAFIAEGLAPTYLPDRIEWLREMPFTANGKMDRVALKARAQASAQRTVS